MATISTFERNNKQPSISRDGNILTFSEEWNLVLSSYASPVEAELLISALGANNSYGWPRVGIDTHPNNASLKPTGFSAEHKSDQGTNIFTVTLSYTNEIPDINRSQRALDADPVYSYQNVDVVIEVDIDPINEKAIAASNGEAYFPKIQRKGTNKRIIVSRNERQYDPNRAIQYEDKLNKTRLRIDGRYYPIRTLLLESWTGKSAVDNNGEDYYQVQYQFLFDPNGHKITLIDAASGPDKNGVNPQQYNLTAGKSHKLDGNGVYLSRTQQNDPTSYSTNEFYVHDEIAMSFLRL